ncbi:hypothetical protein G6F64_001908 [Rhizopus arrhizus]|uniref:Uncharacterized protein n=1 Tax=Rhizopus oryzae TaxID=64495 RepID=A0A9P6XH70_RHIOR|nr:hypothetical protein G6F64_001908 [Rhizopus arrhizus]
MSNYNKAQPETIPGVYREHYKPSDPCYDLYPSLLRRLCNGHIQVPIQTTSLPDGFILPKVPYANRLESNEDPFWGPQQSQEQQDLNGQWDLYPNVLRNIENFGTDQMRQRLYRMKSTVPSR